MTFYIPYVMYDLDFVFGLKDRSYILDNLLINRIFRKFLDCFSYSQVQK